MINELRKDGFNPPPENSANILDFERASDERTRKILESTQIVITEEEFCHAKRWLALAYITGGEHFFDRDGKGLNNHKIVYQKQEILPSSEITISGSDIKDKIDSVVPYITSQHVRNLYKRLAEKRPKYFFGESDITEDKRTFKQDDPKHSVDIENYISYAEMDFCSSLMQVSGDVNFVNDGNRINMGMAMSHDRFEREGRIAGLVGARFEIKDAMESTNLKNGIFYRLRQAHGIHAGSALNDFGKYSMVSSEFTLGHKAIWDEFYKDQQGISEAQDEELNEERLIQRLYISYKKFFADAIADVKKTNKKAHIRVVGIGDGVWAGPELETVQKAIGKAVAKILKEDLKDPDKDFIDTIEFCSFGNGRYLEGFNADSGNLHIKDIKITSNNKAPFSDKIPQSSDNKKLYVCFAWDSGSYVGNEYWLAPPHHFQMSGDPAAAACSSIPISMNPKLNPQFLDKVKVVKSRGCEIVDLSDSSLNKDGKFFKVPELKGASAPSKESGAKETGVSLEVKTRIAKNKATLQQIYGHGRVFQIEQSEEFFVTFLSREDANSHSQELFSRQDGYKIQNLQSQAKHICFQYRNSSNIVNNHDHDKTDADVECFGIIFTNDNIDKIRKKKEDDDKRAIEKKDKINKNLAILKDKALKHFHFLNGEDVVDYYVVVAEVKDVSQIQELKKSTEERLQNFPIKGSEGSSKVLVPLDMKNQIIYGPNDRYDYDSHNITKFAIILTEANISELSNMQEEQIKMLIEEKNDITKPVGEENPSSKAPQNNNLEYAGLVIGGLTGVATVTVCATALGVGIVSTPVIVTALGVGLVGAGIGFALAKPIAESLTKSKESENFK
jgi:hypothetical protein